MEQSAEQCRFLEAETARQKIEELKKDVNSNDKTDLKERHFQEMDDIEKANSEEVNQFDKFWDEKMNDFREQSEKMEEEMLARH